MLLARYAKSMAPTSKKARQTVNIHTNCQRHSDKLTEDQLMRILAPMMATIALIVAAHQAGGAALAGRAGVGLPGAALP